MACTYDLSTNVGKIRLLISDIDVPDGCAFTDEELSTFFEMGQSSIALASSLAFMAMAGDASKIAIKMKNDVTETDTTKTADSLRAQARDFRENPDKYDAAYIASLIAAMNNGTGGFVAPPDRIFVPESGMTQEYISPTTGTMKDW
jgi:hypothetical protein